MKISSIKYFCVDAIRSLRRNFTLSLASVATVAASLFVLGIFLLTIQNANKLVGNLQNSVEVQVYLKDDINTMQQKNIENSLKEDNQIQDVKYVSKDQALSDFKNQLKDSDALSGYDNSHNPLPASFTLKLKAPEYADSVTSKAEKLDGVESVKNQRQIVSGIIAISKAVRYMGIAMFILLTIVSFFLIGNTIRLAVYSRRREIGIMKFVGATDWFIRWPFIIEGLIIGVIGSVISNTLLYITYKAVFNGLTSFSFKITLINPSYAMGSLVWEFLFGGAIIGALASIVALRRFLKV
ncbi:ABC transporter permease [Clostridium sp. 19966]|uniref:permease-like cell division protein FtsX n=1 Tax=Clostridium sp. 19966 TaxID=2768166 RepID=UPI0028DE6B23|nr:permease-like cell division protein FtsX [Clostridium sp. 19966]MDT8716103.1 ABC transporter permease [Clostridium sp. 19966]